MKKLLESFAAIFGVSNDIILEKTKDSGSFRTNHSVSQKQG